AARDAPHTEREVEEQGAGGDDLDLAALRGVLTKFHDRALAIALDDLADGGVEGLFLFQSSCLLGRCGECCTSRWKFQSRLNRRRGIAAHDSEQVFERQVWGALAVLTSPGSARPLAASASRRKVSSAAWRRLRQRSPSNKN